MHLNSHEPSQITTPRVDDRRIRFVPLLHRHFSTGAVPPPPPLPPRPVTLGARPLLFISTFVVLYQSLATLALIPAYGYFHFTDSSTAFLVGPYITSLLRKPLPFSPGGRTVEDALDTVMGRCVKTGWRFWSKWKGREADEREGDEIAKDVLEELEGKGNWRERTQALRNRLVEMKDRATAMSAERGEHGFKVNLTADALRDWKERAIRGVPTAKEAVDGSHKMMNLTADKLRGWKDGAVQSLPEFDEVVERKNGAMKRMTDAAAAYLVVKASAPLRLAASLFLTPKLARIFVRRWNNF